MEPAKMKTHHGYFPGKQMSAVGTKRTFQHQDISNEPVIRQFQ